jgi:hypothetical protein
MPNKPAPAPTIIPQPLRVKIETTPAVPTPKWVTATAAFIVLLSIFILILAFVFAWTVTRPVTSTAANLPVTVTLDLPQNISQRDPWVVTLNLRNNDTQPLNLNLTLRTEPGDFIALTEEGPNSVEIKNLPPGGTYSKIFTYLPLAYPQNGTVTLKVDMQNTATNAQSTMEDTAWQARVWRFPPHLQYFVSLALTSSGLLGLFSALLWERFKKALNG